MLKILKEKSDVSHKLSQLDISRMVESTYGVPISRDCVSQNLRQLIAAGFPIVHEKGGWFWDHPLDDSDLDLIIACVQSCFGLPEGQRNKLISSLRTVGGAWYHPVAVYDSLKPGNHSFIYCLGSINEAIRRDRRIKFHYCDWDVDKRLHLRMDQKDPTKKKVYVASPYAAINYNNRYYLVCNINKYSSLTHFRVDRIVDLEITSKPRKKPSLVDGMKDFSIGKYVAEHPFMYSGKSKTFRIRTERCLVNDLFD